MTATPPPTTIRPGSAAERFLTDEAALELLARSASPARPELSRRGYRAAKRTLDIVAAGGALAVLALPGLVLCAAILARSPGASPIYAQHRVGRVRPDGTFRTFRMLKFRSMVPDAERLLPALQEANEATGPLFKMREDPRVIPGLGTVIRRLSIDELPQLVNVLMGDMSLIGPRPALPREVVQYDERAHGRLAVKPGCGGPWQAFGRSDVGFEEMVELDLAYVERRGLAEDLRLTLETLRAVLSREGAA